MTTPNRSSEYALALGAGTRLVQYEIERVLGQGSFGITYLASEPLLGEMGEKVAIKEFLPWDLAGRATDQDTVVPHTPERRDLFRHGLEKFLEEARRLKLLSKGNPPNIVPVRTAFEANGTAYLVMDYYEGKTLSAYIGTGGSRGEASATRKLETQDAVTTIVQVLRGLAAVHDKGFVHRDVKPDNIYLRFREDGTREALLLDFGAARQALLEQKRTADWTVVLSRGYAPPEQYQRSGEQGPWTDIYACAAVLYQLITGEVPPEGDLRERAAQGLLKGEDVELIPPSRLAPECTPGIDAAIQRGLALDPAERPQSAIEFMKLLQEPEPAAEAPAQPPAPTVVMDHGATVVLDRPAGAGAEPRGGRRPTVDPPARRQRKPPAPAPAKKPAKKPRKRTGPSPAVMAVVVLLTAALGAVGYFRPWSPSSADALPRQETVGVEAAEPPVVRSDEPVEGNSDTPPPGTPAEDDQEDQADQENPEPARPQPDRTPPSRAVVPPPARETVAEEPDETATEPRQPVVSSPSSNELDPVAEALVLGNIHLEGARFNQADDVVGEALRQVAGLLTRYPQADTLHILQRELRRLRQENRANCVALAEVVGGECPDGGR